VSSVPAAATAADPEAAYYQTVEEFFVSRRGDPLFLSNADWLLVRKWRVAGVPLRVVLRGIADALDGHAHSFSRERKVGSLSYCASEVDAAVERWQRALAFGGEEGAGAASCLDTFAGLLEAAAPACGAAGEPARALAREMRDRSLRGEDSVGGLEPWLKEREARLLAALRSEMDAGALAALEETIENGLRPYASRMPEKVLAQVRADARARRVLEAFGLPRLSLFHL
jgi:hypothetical protein